MSYMLIKNGNTFNIALKKYIADSSEKMNQINGNFGDQCFVINENTTYIANSSKEWVPLANNTILEE